MFTGVLFKSPCTSKLCFRLILKVGGSDAANSHLSLSLLGIRVCSFTV